MNMANSGITIRRRESDGGAAPQEAPPTTATPAATPAANEQLPEWLRRVEQLRQARAAHFFLLSSNVTDYVFDGVRSPLRLTDYLVRYLEECGCARVAILSLSRGLEWIELARTPRSATGRQPATGNGSPPLSPDTQRDLARLSSASGAELTTSLRELDRRLQRAGEERIGVLLEDVENMAPRGAHDRESLIATEILSRMAMSDRLRASNCIVIGQCRAPERIAESLIDACGGTVTLRLPLPRLAERRRYLDYLNVPGRPVPLAPCEDGLSLELLANLTQGFSLADLDAFNRDALNTDGRITYERLRASKGEIIKRASGDGMLEEVEARHGFEAIGGLEHIVNYLKLVRDRVRERDLEAVPKGILLTGPPGTGKTIIAEALAKEAGYNFMRMGNVRSMWVGQSEQNLDAVLRLALDMAPVVIFVDEVDQALGSRDSGHNGDSGVSARIFGRILNFMGKNEHRGQVLWIAATNKPDTMDEAMIRRFDRVFPVLMPSVVEREKIFSVMPPITGAVYDAGIDLRTAVERTDGLTGSAIEVIVRRAMELARPGAVTTEALNAAVDDYKPNHDPDEYLLQSLLAVQVANLYSVLPPLGDLPENIHEVLTEMRTAGSAAPLHRRIAELRARLARRY